MKNQAAIPAATLSRAWGRAIRLVMGATGLLALSGCSIPIPQAAADPTRYYVLSTTATGPEATSPANAPVVRLREIELASYLRNRPVIIRRGVNEIQFREFARWGEALEMGIARVLREALLARGAVRAVLPPGRRGPMGENELELNVRFLAFEGGADGTVDVQAAWELTRSGTQPEPVARGEYQATDLRWNGTDEAMLVARLSQAVAGVAAEISAALPEQ